VTVFATISGRFWRAMRSDRVDGVLDAPRPDSAGRYHRHGQPALYLSPHAEWATIAISGYQKADGVARVVVPIDVSPACVLDQRDPAQCVALGIDREASNEKWLTALARGREPPSWRNSDAARAAGLDGIIDRSRHIPDGWHICLFRWNSGGGPSVMRVGDPIPATMPPGVSGWG
jgi:RES domain-containing protein